MKMLKNILGKKTYTEKESRIKQIITNICQKEDIDIRIDPKQLNMFISDEENHYDIVLLWDYVVLVNTKFSLREKFDSDFLDVLKDIVSERASADREKVLQEILRRETEMLKQIEETYNYGQTNN